ncbi:MAG TPA: glycosyltransferase family 2 protein [Mycobacteriales bacterium]|jgi:GT2 family glycosyltransferase|nr:glycosyltransferase family 2 protein [Mycobacteriales bacterium]
MTMTDLAVVVVAYHGAGDLDRCLEPVASSLDVVVVDNSSDPDVAAVARRHGCRYVDSGANLGFAAGVNLGVSQLAPDVDVLLLNPDAVISVDEVRALGAALAADSSLAAVSPRLVDESGAEQRVEWPFPSPARMWREALGGTRFVDEPADFVVGAVLLLRRTAWEDVGGFDERFFLYAEEVDWQRRAVQRGWSSGVAVEAVATHRGAGTSGDADQRDRLFYAASETYIRKWFGTAGWASYRLAAATGAMVRSAVGPARKRRLARARFAAYVAGPRRAAGLDRAGLDRDRTAA